MLFNSKEFLIFLAIVFVLYWIISNKNLKIQNSLILVSSYVFYGWWDYRFLSLIILSTFVDYFIGLKIFNQKIKSQKFYLWISVIFNLSILGFFKYFNFFIESFFDLLYGFGYEIKSKWSLNIILPLGISFYTFQTMSYVIDVYKKKLEPTKDFISFACYVTFFPQLVAGPIERATNLLPQILSKRKFSIEQFYQGLRLILFGLFKKVVIADSLAPLVDLIFADYQNYGGGTLFLGAIYFAFQIYCDFSGYSDIAIGTSKLFGFEIMSNFKFPYFSRNIGEFWRKWHISLSSWFRDYLYIPIGGSKAGKMKSIRNIIVIFLVSGFWHGANWTFLFWGLFHSILFIPSFIFKTNRMYANSNLIEKKSFLLPKELLNISTTFLLVTVGWVFFRSESITDSFLFIKKMIFSFDIPGSFRVGTLFVFWCLILDFLFLNKERTPFNFKNKLIRNLSYVITIMIILSFFSEQNSSFIYFTF